MKEHTIAASRSPIWDDAEVRRRLGRAYALILNYRPKERRTADGGEFGDLTPSAADDAPAVEPETQDEV